MEQVEFSKYSAFIGKRVMKKSKRPFKGGEIIVTVKAIIKHPIGFGEIGGGRKHPLCFTFEENESYVICHMCTEVQRGVELGSNVGIVTI